jgi:hypothetical protein
MQMRNATRFLLVAGLLAGAADGAAARPQLPAAENDRLLQYEVLGYSDPHRGGIDRGKAIGLFDATPDEVFRTATDYDHWAEFMPKIKRTAVLSWNGNDCVVSTTAELKFLGESWIEAKYRHERLPGEVYRVVFEMERGSMRQYLGSILIEPFQKDGMTKSTVTFEVVAEPNMFAPKGILNRMIKRTAVNSVHALRQRVNDMHAAGLLHPSLPPEPFVAQQPQKQRPQAAVK